MTDADPTAAAPGEKSTKNFWGSRNVEFDFNWTPWGQQTENSCWLYAIKLVYQWANEKRSGPSPDTVDDLIKQGVFSGDDSQFQDARNNGLKPASRVSAFNAAKMTPISKSVAVAWEVKDLQQQLDQHGPMVYTQTILHGNGTADYNTHAMVLYGANAQGTDAILLLDPYDEDGLKALALNPGSTPNCKVSTTSRIFSMFKSCLPPDGLSADTALAFLT